VSGTHPMGAGLVSIAGQVPLSELNGYQSRLKSITGGAGSFSMELSHYEPVPPLVQQHLVSQHKVHPED
jgi:elongation factor G